MFELEKGSSEIIKQGIQLTNGIYHGGGDAFSSLMLGFMNPGEQLGFKQPKIQELQYEAYCVCCDKLVKQAKVCSRCLSIYC